MNFWKELLLPNAISTLQAFIEFSIKNPASASARRLYGYLKPLDESINRVLQRIRDANPDL